MTIALGILARDAVIIAADTEEAITGYMKIEQPKVMLASYSGRGEGPRGAVAVSGAGWAGYIDALGQELRDKFISRRLKEDTILSTYDDVLRRFYRRHVRPFANYPPGERPEVEMLVGYRADYHSGLLVTDKTTIREVPGYAAVGSGAIYARGILGQHYDFHGISASHAQLLAVYTIWRVKDRIDGCGKFTQVFTLSAEHGVSWLRDKPIREYEKLFEYHATVESEALTYLIRFTEDDSGDESKAQGFAQTLKGLKQSFREVNPPKKQAALTGKLSDFGTTPSEQPSSSPTLKRKPRVKR